MALRDGGEPASDDEAPHVLLVDDDQRIRTLLQRLLRAQGFRVTAARDAAEARRKLEGLVFDAVVLDIMMPGEDGLSLLASLKQTYTMPVLLLSAKTEADDRVAGLERGADDYLPKPFEPRELALRLANLLRRRPETARRIRFGDFVFDIRREELTRAAEPVRLTDRERRLLRLLASRPGATIPRHELVADEDLGDRAIDVQINRLRRKLEDDPAEPKYLQTMRGQGYRLLADPEHAG
ncbi:response regulator transcription factor [Acuticoccus sp. MNP-M23]|uniref:response regulator transcription factor n=1 Tax=Acuticoccus sp. MNP-M23 TaxID=3072793 RepID=UPI00281671D4|nr:response regulator transcription factor [Acuticoccus sp. MNP-M23]WMS43678.1 response regulator transcription factor [Acuticoccus sp. MNP-M23]